MTKKEILVDEELVKMVQELVSSILEKVSAEVS
jgi:hypothetical protein